MDSEDERELAIMDSLLDEAKYWGTTTPNPELRLFQTEEAEMRLFRDSSSPPTEDRFLILCRVMRFCRSIEGFHKGSLDLTGRHPRRYDSLLRRWDTFAKELNRISERMKIAVLPDTDNQTASEKPVAEDLEEWQQFKSKWRLHDAFDFPDLLEMIGSTISILRSNPEPKFQNLLLLDLPPELLHSIMDTGDQSVARPLGATCKYLRSISQSYIFKHRSLKLSSDLVDWKLVRTLGEEEAMHYFDKMMEQSRSRFLDSVRLLRERPDIQVCVNSLVVWDEWDEYSLGGTSLGEDDERKASFFSPMYKAVCDVVPLVNSLQTLTLGRWHLTMDLLLSLRFLTMLHTLEVRACTSAVHYPVELPQLPSVLKLTLVGNKEEHFDSWIIASMCPNVENLSVAAFGRSGAPEAILPSLEFMISVNPFRTLRKFLIHHIPPFAISALGNWIKLACSQSPNRQLPLTHLKVDVDGGLYRDDLFDFLDSLANLSIEHFVLDGTRYAQPDVLDKIAQIIPRLLSLIVIYRANDIQFRARYIEWPCGSWEYAPHLSSFERLEYFGWNFRFLYDCYSPAAMVCFEENDFSSLSKEPPKKDALFGGEHFTTMCMGSHCPSLRYMAFITNLPIQTFRRVEMEDRVMFEDDDNNLAFSRALCMNPQWEWP